MTSWQDIGRTDSGSVKEGYHMEVVVKDGEPQLVQVKDEATEASEADYYDTQAEKYKGHSSIADDGSGSTLLLAISKSQNATEFIHVKINKDGQIVISTGEEPKE